MSDCGESKKSQSSDRLATLSFVFGIFSLVLFCCCPLGGLAAGLGLIFGILSRGRGSSYAPKARNGVIMSAIGLGIFTLLTVSVITFSLYYFVLGVNSNENFTDELREQAEEYYDSYGIEMDESLNEALEYADEIADWIREKNN